MESKPAIVPVTTLIENVMGPQPYEVRWVSSQPAISLTSICIQQSSEDSPSVVPTKTGYAMATVKEVLNLAQSASSVIPVPFLKDVIGVALKIIQACEVR